MTHPDGHTHPRGRTSTYLRCAGCGRTFATFEARDAHRVGGYDERACADPATIRRHDRDGNDLGPLLELNRWYAWRIRPTETQREAHEAFIASKQAEG